MGASTSFSASTESKERMSTKYANARTIFAVACGLAVCCSVMYITADGEQLETVHAAAAPVFNSPGPKSVQSTDVQKAATIFTNTPDGRMRLIDYFTRVEKSIASEGAARKRDVAAVRAQMARNYAFNKAARAKLEKALLARMKANAHKAHADLVVSMRHVQAQFARSAALANRRNNANIRRSKKLRAIIARNKRAASKNLRVAVLAQQRAMAAWRSRMNARIKQTNKNVAVNAAQIKENAKVARKALEKAMAKFDHKLANSRELAQKGRSKLAAQLRKQDKAARAWASNKLKAVAASTAAQFRETRAQMAKDRHHADMALKSATSRMEAGLNAFKALNDRRFARTVSDIAAAKQEAAKKIAAAQTEFKVGIFRLSSVVKQQVAKTNSRITQLSGVVNKNKLEQAKVNANVNAEMKRMIKLGNERYKEHLKSDKELRRLISKNKAETTARMSSMAAHYKGEIGKIHSTMKRNRAHASRMLSKQTARLYSALEKSRKAQQAVNKHLATQSRRARLDIQDSLRNAKRDFSRRLAKLHGVVIRNEKRFDGRIKKLTGVVNANAVKSAQGRAMLSSMMKANRAELLNDVSTAVHMGEMRMMQVNKKISRANAKTNASMNMRITSEISKLSGHIHTSIEGLRMQSKAARAEMKKEMLYAVRSAAKEAKKNLAAVVKASKAKFARVARAEAAAVRRSAAARASLARRLRASRKSASRSLSAAVAGLNRSMLALKTETSKKIAKTNRDIDAHARQMARNAKKVKAAMKANVAALSAKISAARKEAQAAIRGANAASAAQEASVLKALKISMASALKKSQQKFDKVYVKLAKDRAHADQALGGAVNAMNDGLAKQASLADARFGKTVKNIAAARAQAARQLANARKSFTTAVAGVTAHMKDQETRLTGEIAVVSGEVISQRANQMRVNRRVGAELKKIVRVSNQRYSHASRARGKLRALLNENKRAAAAEVAALARSTKHAVGAIRSQSARNARDAAKDLTKATSKMYGKLASIQLAQSVANRKLKRRIGAYSAKAAAQLRSARRQFGARLSTLTNTVAANYKKTETLLTGLTGVIKSNKAAAKRDRTLIRQQTKGIQADLNKKIVRAIQIGEARAKKVADRARAHLAATKKSLLIEISEKVEHCADKLFKTIQGNHQKIADNYLSLKAYAAAGRRQLKNYVAKGKGRNLSSLGDLLMSVAALAPVKAVKCEGIGAGRSTLPPIFGGKNVKVTKSVSKINGLVNEYVNVITQVRRRWPMGLGKYLLMKTEQSMQNKGVLQVDKVANRSGNWVFVNGRAVGLSNKLADFEGLAVHMARYEATLAKLTAKLSSKHSHTTKKNLSVKPPEWRGN